MELRKGGKWNREGRGAQKWRKPEREEGQEREAGRGRGREDGGEGGMEEGGGQPGGIFGRKKKQ